MKTIRRSSQMPGIKMVIFIPLALVCFIFCATNSFSQNLEKDGNKVSLHGNKFEFPKFISDSIRVFDPIKNVTKMEPAPPYPLKMNGNAVQQYGDMDEKDTYFTGDDKDLRTYLLKKLKDELIKLGEGAYRLNINNILVEPNGGITYFEYSGITKAQINNGTGGDLPKEINNKTQQKIFDKVRVLMDNAPKLLPTDQRTKKVVYMHQANTFWNYFKITNNKLYDVDKTGALQEL